MYIIIIIIIIMYVYIFMYVYALYYTVFLQTGMTDADYITAFQQLLLPVAYQVTLTCTGNAVEFISSPSWFWW